MPQTSPVGEALEPRARELDDNVNLPYDASHVPNTSGATLLPKPAASVVSFLTQSTSLSLRVGTFLGGVALDSARITTLTGLELGRAVLEGILIRAGRDIQSRSGGERGKEEAESLLEKSLGALHSTVTSASFFAAATFHLSSTTLSSISHLSQTLLSSLDAILGSTESSRAIAAIITLIRRQYRNPDLGVDGENIGVGDLLVGSVGFALLQRWGRRNTEREIRDNGGDEVIWDVVILDNGIRADVVGTHRLEYAETIPDDSEKKPRRAASFMSVSKTQEPFNAVQRGTETAESLGVPHLTLPPERQHEISDEELRAYIMKQLPEGCRAKITTDQVTARTITVDIFDDDSAEITAPPGTMIIAERFHHHQDYPQNGHLRAQDLPRHTVVFRTAFSKSQSAELRRHQSHESHPFSDSDQEQEDGSPGSARSTSSILSRTQKLVGKDKPLPPIDTRMSDAHPSAHRASLSGQGGLPAQSATNSHEHDTEGSIPNIDGRVDPHKGAFGSLSKIAQKVKPVVAEKSGATKKPSPKRSSAKSVSSSPAGGLAQGAQKGRHLHVDRKANLSGPAAKPNSKIKRSETSTIVNPRVSSPILGRDSSRVPLTSASSFDVTASPVTHHMHSGDIRRGSQARSGYFSVRERHQGSYVAQTDSYSIRSMDFGPRSPSAGRTHVRSSSSMSMARSEAEGTVSLNGDGRPTSSAMRQRSTSFAPSFYSVATAGSETSLVLAHRPRKSVYDDLATIQALNRHGTVPGLFPERHFVENIRRFCRFSSASYGSNALKVMGVRQANKALTYHESDSHEHSAFSTHTGLPPSTILLSSYVDPSGGSNAAGETDSGFPLVHYLCLDHESKAIVLTLRGTWGFEDVLTDMTCDYVDLEWQGKNWKVHKGMHASARRLLEGGGGRVMITIRAALEEFPEYGVILCGHSLGGGVAALLATMISSPNPEATGPSFVTASYRPRPMLPARTGEETSEKVYYSLPAGRPIHVYAYGPPAVMSPFLRRATRGLITTIVNGQDIVPSLSLGILHDLHAVAFAFKSDASGAKSEVRHRIWESLRQSVVNKFYVNQAPLVIQAGDGIGEDAWAWKTLKLLREEMRAPKLMPPGEVFMVQTMRVLQRDAFTSDPLGDGYPRLGRPATRAQLKFIRDVEAWFGEVRFGSGMLSDHNPARYEASLAAVARGVLDD